MTPDDAFLQAIAESPEDDTPRLIYADWLEDHGERDYARFIRIQCELERLQEENDYWLDLKIQEEDLWGLLQSRWVEALWGRLESPWKEVLHLRLTQFKRGFLDGANLLLKPAQYVRESSRWVFLVGIDHLDLADAMCDEFFACPGLWRVRSMNCERSHVKDSSLQGFLDAQHFHNLGSISFFRNYIGPDGISTFARCPSLINLRGLDLDENQLGDEGLHTLVSSPVCAKLERLRLSENNITEAGLRSIVESPYLANLRDLLLSGNELRGVAVESLFGSPALPNLQHLHLDWFDFPEEDENNEVDE